MAGYEPSDAHIDRPGTVGRRDRVLLRVATDAG